MSLFRNALHSKALPRVPFINCKCEEELPVFAEAVTRDAHSSAAKTNFQNEKSAIHCHLHVLLFACGSQSTCSNPSEVLPFAAFSTFHSNLLALLNLRRARCVPLSRESRSARLALLLQCGKSCKQFAPVKSSQKCAFIFQSHVCARGKD